MSGLNHLKKRENVVGTRRGGSRSERTTTLLVGGVYCGGTNLPIPDAFNNAAACDLAGHCPPMHVWQQRGERRWLLMATADL